MIHVLNLDHADCDVIRLDFQLISIFKCLIVWLVSTSDCSSIGVIIYDRL